MTHFGERGGGVDEESESERVPARLERPHRHLHGGLDGPLGYLHGLWGPNREVSPIGLEEGMNDPYILIGRSEGIVLEGDRITAIGHRHRPIEIGLIESRRFDGCPGGIQFDDRTKIERREEIRLHGSRGVLRPEDPIEGPRKQGRGRR